MPLTPEQRDLGLVVTMTALMWVPYTLALIAKYGIGATIGNRSTPLDLPAWAERAQRAHRNAVENLVLFAPLLLLATMQAPGAEWAIVAARVYLYARLIHYGVYVAGIPGLRTLAFLTAWVATVSLAVFILW